MWKALVLAPLAPILVATAPYTDEQLASGFALFISMGKDIAPLMSADVPKDVAEQLRALRGCKVQQVETLATKYTGYGVQWHCPKHQNHSKTAAVIKISDGKIYQILMSDVF